MADLGFGVIYGIVRMRSGDMESAELHSLWPDSGSAVTARQRFGPGQDTRDCPAYQYEVVPIAFGERLDPLILRRKAEEATGRAQ